MLSILITEEEKKYPPDALVALRKLGTVRIGVLTQAQLLEIIPDYDILIVGLGLHINKDVIDRGTRLKLIATATTGIDHVDVAYAESKKIPVLSLRGELDILEKVTATAEIALGLMIALVRHIPPAAESVKRREWKRERYEGSELSGKTLGVVGLGRLGKHMARYGNALLMRVLVADPHIDAETAAANGAELVPLDDLLAHADVVSLHVILNEQTTGMIGERELKLMKPSAVLVNSSRGQIVDEAAVLAALNNKTIAGYATDVLSHEVAYHEQTDFIDPLVEYAREHDNCLIVPHLGGMAVEAAWKTRGRMTNKVIDVCSRW